MGRGKVLLREPRYRIVSSKPRFPSMSSRKTYQSSSRGVPKRGRPRRTRHFGFSDARLSLQDSRRPSMIAIAWSLRRDSQDEPGKNAPGPFSRLSGRYHRSARERPLV